MHHRLYSAARNKMELYRPLVEKCERAYKEAKTHTDSMIVHVARFGDTYHGEPSCLELGNLYRSIKK
jgi:hypothetical protein